MNTAATIDDQARQRVIVALEERARLLRPDEALIEEGLKRCLGQVSLEAAAEAGIADLRQVPESGSAGSSGVADQAQVATEPGTNQSRDAEVFKRGRDGRSGQVLESGVEIAGYRVESMIGKGGMGQVYKVLQLSVNRHVALKVLSPRLARNPSLRSRFLREARNAGRLQHPHLIGVHDVGEVEGLLFFSLELVSGRSVRELLKRDGPFEEDRAREIIGEVLEALTFAHGHGLIHRDIKPDNIMITDEGVVKVADLGLSRSAVRGAGEEGATTRSGSVMGTPYYMPPEQGRDASNVDHRADIYAVGATLYHMVCGRVPYSGRTPVDVLVRASTQPLTFPEDGPSSELRRIIARLMAKDPAARPASAEEAQSLVLGKHLVLQHSARLFGERSGYQHTRHRSATRLVPILLSLCMLVAVMAAAGWGLMWHLEGRAIRRLEARFHFLCEQGQFVEAHSLLAADDDRGPRYAPVVSLLENELLQRWRQHLQDQWAEDLDEVEAFLAAGQYAQAYERLKGLAHADDPPFVEAFLTEVRARIEYDESLSWVSGVQFESDEEIAIHGPGSYIIRGHGEGRVPVDASMPVAAAVQLSITIEGHGVVMFDKVVGKRRWRYRIDQDRLQAISWPRTSTRDSRTHVNRRHDGTVHLELRRREDALVIAIPGGDAEALAMPWSRHAESLPFRWQIDRGSARMEFGPAAP